MIIGGIKSIARVTDKVVPFMAVLYITASLIVIFANVTMIPAAFGEIITGAFNPQGVVGGIVGVLIVGFQRAAFSNEAGVGSASIAHSAVRTKEPATEGFVSLLEPFIDTIVICTMTALVIVITGVWQDPERLRTRRRRADHVRVPVGAALVPVRPGGRRRVVRVLHDDRLVLLRHESHRLPVR